MKIENALEMQVEIYYRNIKNINYYKKHQKKGIKSSTTYFPGASSESKERDISINKEKRKVPIIPLRFISEEQIPHLQVQSGKQF